MNIDTKILEKNFCKFNPTVHKKDYVCRMVQYWGENVNHLINR